MAEITLQLTALNRGAYSDQSGVYPLATLPTEEIMGYNKYIASFSAFPSQYNYRTIYNCKLHLYVYPGVNNYGNALISKIGCAANYRSWNPATVTYNDINISRLDINALTPAFNSLTWQPVAATLADYKVSSILERGILFIAEDGYSYSTGPKFVTTGANAPYLTVSVSDSDVYLKVYSASPTGGYQAKSQQCTFNWTYSSSGSSLVTPTLTNSKFKWRTSSSATAVVIDCGTNLTYTMPANTVSTDSFQWQCEITDSTGYTSTSEWYTISTLEALSTANCIAPKNICLDGGSQNEFTWEHIISTGTAQTRADLQYSSNAGSTWNTLATVSGSQQSKIISAGFFSSGEYLWRVRTYNTDNNAGSWSDACAFSVISAPSTPIVSSEQNPKPLVSWQSSDQQGFRVTIDGIYDSGIVYGSETSHRLGMYLPDGTYTVKVKVQNSYGIWSAEGSAPINVTNTAGPSMTLSCEIGTNFMLTWTPQLSYAYYLVYRDNVPIAKIRENSYNDKTAIGEHTYFIRGIYASNQYYGLSNTITVNVSVDNPTLYALNEDVSLELITTDSSYSEINVEESIVAAEMIISAADYPLIELSRHKNKSVAFTVSYKYENSDRLVFERLLGKEVSIKTPKGSIAYGTLLGISKREHTFFITYNCTLKQSAIDEEVKL